MHLSSDLKLLSLGPTDQLAPNFSETHTIKFKIHYKIGRRIARRLDNPEKTLPVLNKCCATGVQLLKNPNRSKIT